MSRVLAVSLAALFTLSTYAERPPLIPNSVKYKDTGLEPASGRDGDIAVQARALLGRDNVTDLEVTTARFDDPSAATGTLNRVQVKVGLTLEDPITRNYEASGTFASFRLDGLALKRRENVQVRVNALSADGTRAGVVTVTETVKRRPDLRLNNPSLPPTAIAGNPTHFYVNVGESNGDIGARADCVLRVDGVEVDRASNIWVDRLGTVTCAMMHAFATPGAKQVRISLENVSPADWNPSNNSVGPYSIDVRDASEVVAGGSYLMTAVAETEDDESMETSDQTHPDWNAHHAHNVEKTNITLLEASVPYAFDLNSLRASFAEESDGQLLKSFVYDGFPPFGNCVELEWARASYASACVQNGVTNFHYWRGNTVARYYSRWWGQYTFGPGDVYTYDFEMDDQWTFGGIRQYGSTVSMQFIVADANHSWQIHPFANMVPWSEPEQYTSGCRASWSGDICWWRRLSRSGANGRDTEADH